MKIALAQINPTVGDIAGNVRKIKAFASRAKAKGAKIVAFPELSITGYPPRDLVEHPHFVTRNEQAVAELAAQVSDIALIVGFVGRNENPVGKRLRNSVALLKDGKIADVRAKQLLPTYDVFDETRHFAPVDRSTAVTIDKLRVGLTICEDMWNDANFWPHRLYEVDPIRELAKQNVLFHINISSSPFHHGKTRLRYDMVRSHVQNVRTPFFFVNQVGGNDELIFDGSSFAVDAHGNLIAQAKAFQEDLLVVDTKTAGSATWREAGDIEQIRDALILGLKDYARKCGFQKVVLGLSGGIDSAVTAALAVEALGKENVLGVSMPGPFSSRGSVTDAKLLAKMLGVRLISLPITKAFDAYRATLRSAFVGRKPDVTEENLQARIRGTMLMALSNKFGMLLLTTGNKSEISTGYCTLYGDMNGGLAVISDVPKMKVYALGRLLNARKIAIPEATFTKPPSAELRPNQTDQDSLPPYEVLDAIVEAYVEEGKDVDEIVAEGHPKETVQRILKLIDRNEYKRRQAAPGLRITSKAFGMGRRMPIARGDFRS